MVGSDAARSGALPLSWLRVVAAAGAAAAVAGVAPAADGDETVSGCVLPAVIVTPVVAVWLAVTAAGVLTWPETGVGVSLAGDAVPSGVAAEACVSGASACVERDWT